MARAGRAGRAIAGDRRRAPAPRPSPSRRPTTRRRRRPSRRRRRRAAAACPGAVGLAVEQQLRILRRVIAAKASGVRSVGSRPTNAGVDAERLELGDARSRRTDRRRPCVSTALRCPSRAAATATLVAVPPIDLTKRCGSIEAGAGLVGVEVDADPPDRQQLERRSSAAGHRSLSDDDSISCSSCLELGAAGHQLDELVAGDLAPWRSCRGSGRA